MNRTVKMQELQSRNAGIVRMCYDMYWNFQGFFVNSTVKSKARVSFWPVAHRNRLI